MNLNEKQKEVMGKLSILQIKLTTFLGQKRNIVFFLLICLSSSLFAGTTTTVVDMSNFGKVLSYILGFVVSPGMQAILGIVIAGTIIAGFKLRAQEDVAGKLFKIAILSAGLLSISSITAIIFNVTGTQIVADSSVFQFQ